MNYYEGKEGKSVIYNIYIDDDSSSIANIIPKKDTRDDVLRKLGEPTSEHEEDISETIHSHILVYGDKGTISGINGSDAQCVTVSLNTDNIVNSVSISYVSK